MSNVPNISEFVNQKPSPSNRSGSHLNEVAEAAKRYVQARVETGVVPEDAAKAANYSLKQLNRIFSLYTGMTLAEYVRWSKLAKALFEVRHGDAPLIDIALKYGYQTQEGFTRAFKDHFAVTPGDYRKSRHPITAKNWHVNELIHQEAHATSHKGPFTLGCVDNWLITKPERLWIPLRTNVEGLPAHEFYDLCGKEGVIGKASFFPDAVGVGGAYFSLTSNCLLSFGVEVEAGYPQSLIDGHEVVRIPQSQYVVFNYPKYSIEDHGDAIRSTWGTQKDYDIAAHGLKWDFDGAPVLEEDHGETGYTLWFPACDA